MIQKQIGKVVLAALMAAFSLVTFASEETSTAIIEDITLSRGGAPYAVAASAQGDWEPVMAEPDIAKAVYEGDHYVIRADVDGMDGETKVILKSNTSAKHLVFNVKVVSIEMTKHAVKLDPKGNTATVEVVSHYFVGHPKSRSRALVIGTACSSHAGSKENMLKAITNAVNAVATRGTVDYIFFYDSGSSVWRSVEGTVDQNSHLTATQVSALNEKLSSGNHAAMQQFYDTLYAVATGSVNYDYIFLEFDGNMLGGSASTHTTYVYDEAREKTVARYLLPYYDLGRIYWIVNDFESTKADQLDDGTNYFRPVQYGKGVIAADTKISQDGKQRQYFWRGLLGLLNPDLFVNYSGEIVYNESAFSTITKKPYGEGTAVTAMVGHQITGGIGNESAKHWTTYNAADTIAQTLTEMIVDRRISATVADRLNPNLTVVGARFSMSTNSVEPRTWTSAKLDGMTVTCGQDGNCVTGAIAGVSYETWTKLEIDVKDEDGKFLVPGTFWHLSNGVDKVTGYYDPNVDVNDSTKLGPAITKAYDTEGKLYAQTNGWTSLAWTYEMNKLGVRAENVVTVYNGQYTNIVKYVVTNELSGAVINDAVISNSYTGTSAWQAHNSFQGYRDVTNAAPVYHQAYAPNYQPSDVGFATVTINPAEIKPPVYPGPGPGPGPGPKPDPEPDYYWASAYDVEKVYDGIGTNVVYTYGRIDVVPTFRFAYTETAPAPESSDWQEYANIFTNVMYEADGKTVRAQKVWMRVEAGPNYIPTNLFAYVKITPKDLGDDPEDGVVAENKSMTYGGTLPELTWKGGNGLVDGDGFETVSLALATNVAAKVLAKGTYTDLIATNAAITVTNATGDVTGNYKMAFTPGTLTVGPKELKDDDPEDPAAGVIALSTNMVYGTTGPATTALKWVGLNGLENDDYAVVELSFATNVALSTLDVGTYTDLIQTNVAVKILSKTDEDVTDSYDIAFYAADLKVTPKPVGPNPEDPRQPAEDITISPIPSREYDGQPYEPIVAVTNGVIELEIDKDYTVTYHVNTNATEEAYALITGIGNYCGVYTNYFSILPRHVTIRSCTTEKYLPEGGGLVVATNYLTCVIDGSFVENSLTGEMDGYIARNFNRLESDQIAGPVPNTFVVEATQFPTNYLFELVYGDLEIKEKPLEHKNIIEEVLGKDGDGIVIVEMNNEDAGPWAADAPPELRHIATNIVCGVGETNIVQLKVQDTSAWDDQNWTRYRAVTNEIVETAYNEGAEEREVKRFMYEAFDITLSTMKWRLQDPTVVTTNDHGSANTEMLTITIPYAFRPHLQGIRVWRNHNGAIEEFGMNSPLPTAQYGEYFTTNAEGVVLHEQKFSEIVIMTTYDPPDALLDAKLAWAYNNGTGEYVASLKLTCLNDPDYLDNENVYFAFETRQESGTTLAELRKWTSDRRGTVAADAIAFDNGTSLPACTLTQGAQIAATGTAGMQFGPASTAGSTVWMNDRVAGYPCLYVAKRLQPTAGNAAAALVNSFVGYVVWKTHGVTMALPITAGAPDETPVAWLAPSAGGPLSISALNLAYSLGLPLDATSDPTCSIVDFQLVGENAISGRVQTTAGNQTGVPAANARVVLLGTDSLASPFAEVGSTFCDADGRFTIEKDLGSKFFKISIQPVEQFK